MKITLENRGLLLEKILQAESKLQSLQKTINQIGLPAAQHIKRRVDALKIEAHALKRNFEESQLLGDSDSHRLDKIEALLRHIEREESSVQHEAEFLNRSAPSSITLAVEAGARLINLYRSGFKRIIGDAHPLGESVFVNHSHEYLKSSHGFPSRDKPNA